MSVCRNVNRGTHLRDPVSGVLRRRDIVIGVLHRRDIVIGVLHRRDIVIGVLHRRGIVIGVLPRPDIVTSVGLGNLAISNDPVINQAANPSLTGNSGVDVHPKDPGVAVAEDGINGETTSRLIPRNISKRVNIVTSCVNYLKMALNGTDYTIFPTFWFLQEIVRWKVPCLVPFF